MPLTRFNLSTGITWSLSKPNPGQDSTVQSDALHAILSGIDLTTYNQLFTPVYTLVASATTTVDVSTGLTNLVGDTFGFTAVLAFVAKATGSECTIEPGATNGLQWFFGTSSQVIVPSGGIFVFSGVNQAVSGSGKNLKFTNSGATPLTLEVAILGDG